jgi:DNA-binding GntR family transcriptional regulator
VHPFVEVDQRPRVAASAAADLDEEGAELVQVGLGSALGSEPRALIDLDERIHRAIYHASHNPYLAETLIEYYAHALRIWMVALSRTDIGAAVGGHHAVLEAIVRGDGARAARLMREHVESFEAAVRDVLLAE